MSQLSNSTSSLKCHWIKYEPSYLFSFQEHLAAIPTMVTSKTIRPSVALCPSITPTSHAGTTVVLLRQGSSQTDRPSSARPAVVADVSGTPGFAWHIQDKLNTAGINGDAEMVKILYHMI